VQSHNPNASKSVDLVAHLDPFVATGFGDPCFITIVQNWRDCTLKDSSEEDGFDAISGDTESSNCHQSVHAFAASVCKMLVEGQATVQVYSKVFEVAFWDQCPVSNRLWLRVDVVESGEANEVAFRD